MEMEAVHQKVAWLMAAAYAGLPVESVFKGGIFSKEDTNVTMERAITEVIESKRATGRRAKYVHSLGADYLQRFARGREQTPISDFSSKDIEHWISKFKSPSTRQTWVNRLSTLFTYAKRKRYIEHNPCKEIETIISDHPTPQILTVGQIKACLDFTMSKYPHHALGTVLAVLVGIRPEELRRMNKEQLVRDLTQGIIVIDSEVSKVRNRRRVIELTIQQKEWICATLPPARFPAPVTATQKYRIALRTHLGFKVWPRDIFRHTALSHALVMHQNAAKVALFSGNSPYILLTHYNGLVTPAEHQRFIKLMPPGKHLQMELL